MTEQCCGTTCDRAQLEIELKIQGATEFIDLLVVKYGVPLGEETALLEDLEDYVAKVNSL